MSILYLVIKYDGDYEDTEETVLCAYLSKERAEAHREQLKNAAEAAKELWEHFQTLLKMYDKEHPKPKRTSADKNTRWELPPDIALWNKARQEYYLANRPAHENNTIRYHVEQTELMDAEE